MKAKAIILAAGQGTRMKSPLPKVLHPLAGQSMIKHLLGTLSTAGMQDMCVVIGPDMDNLRKEVSPLQTVEQTERRGTGHAVKMAQGIFPSYDEGCFFVLFGDTPLVTKETLEKMYRQFEEGADIIVMGFTPADPARYGRLLVKDGELQAIVEYKDASDEERAIRLCNAGLMCISGKYLWSLIAELKDNNAAHEYYLTDIVKIGRVKGLKAVVVEGDAEEVLGVNSRLDLSIAEKVVQKTLARKAMDSGVTLLHPESVHFNYDTVIGADSLVEPNVYFGENVTVGEGAVIHSFSYLENCSVPAHGEIGPMTIFKG